MICYDPLWNAMKQKGITTYTLINQYKINPRTIHNLKHNQSITMFTMEKLCRILDCQAEGIVKFVFDDEKGAE